MTNRCGYSLIEIIVVIAIGAILSSIGLFGLNKLNRRQVIVQNAKTVVSEIKKAKNLADAQQKPEGCTVLSGYSLEITNENLITIWAVCENDNYEHQSRTMTASLENLRSIFFPVLQQAASFVSDDGTGKLIINQNSQSIIINIGYTGVVEYE